MNDSYVVTFPDWYVGPYELEAEAKGYLYDVEVTVNGALHRVTFVDDYTIQHDKGFSEDEVVVVERVSRAVILDKIRALVAAGAIGPWLVSVI